MACPKCKGRGYVLTSYGQSRCETCMGKGEVDDDPKG